MSISHFIYSLGFLVLLAACSNQQSIDNSSTNNTANNSKQKEEDKKRCFYLHTIDINEALYIVDEEHSLTGTIQGQIFTNEIIPFNGTIKGNCKNDTCHVSIHRIYDSHYGEQKEEQIWLRQSNKAYKILSGFTLPFELTQKVNAYNAVRCVQFAPHAEYDIIFGFIDGYAVAGQNGVFRIIDSNYTKITDLDYTYMSDIREGSISFMKQGEMQNFYGIMDIKGNVIIPNIYSMATPFVQGISAVMNEDGWFFINREGKTIIKPNNYVALNSNIHSPKHINFIGDNLIALQKGDKWGYLDLKGNIAIPFIYNSANSFANGKATVNLNGKNIVIDKTGKCLENCL